jgi:hypothetical protein
MRSSDSGPGPGFPLFGFISGCHLGLSIWVVNGKIVRSHLTRGWVSGKWRYSGEILKNVARLGKCGVHIPTAQRLGNIAAL